MSSSGWSVVVESGTPARLHDLDVAGPQRPMVRVCEPTSPAVVLGGSQSPDLVDAEAAAGLGLDVVVRRSGGGAVHVTPGADVWVDVIVPAGHRLSDADVGRAFWWLGEVCSGVVASTGAVPRMHRGGWVPGRSGRLVCFAGLGPGEVTVGGRKVVGISQRRTRDWSRLSVTVLTRWDPAPLGAVLRPLQRSTADLAALGDVAVGLGVDRVHLRDALVEAITAA